MVVSYEVVTENRAGSEHSRPYTSDDELAPGSIVLLGGRYWLVDRVEGERVHAKPARYRLVLRYEDGHEDAGAFRRYRSDAPGIGHQFTTVEDGTQASWQVVDERLAHDGDGEPFLESVAERDFAEAESLPDHQLEHTLEQDEEEDDAAVAALDRAETAGLAIELVALEAGQAPDWQEAERYLDALTLDEIEDDLLEMCGVNTARDPQDTWLDRVKARLHDDLASLRDDIEGDLDEIEEWDFRGGKIYAAVGSFEDESNPLSGHGWMCRLIDAGVLVAAGFQRVRKAALLP